MAFDRARSMGRLIPVALCFVWTPVATAQVPRPGQRLRITAPTFQTGHVVGGLVRLDRDSLVLERDGQPWAVPRELVTRAETFNGTHGRALRGALIGGLAVAAFLGQDMLRNPSACEGSGNYGQLCAILLVGSALAGAGVGALIGTAIRRDDWIEVSLESTGSVLGPPMGYAEGPAALDGRRLRGSDTIGVRGRASRHRFSLVVMLPLKGSSRSRRMGAPSN